jgi:hypothetical protein
MLKPEYLKIVRYKPTNQKTGKAKQTEAPAAIKTTSSLIDINCSRRKKKASQVQKIHKIKSIIIAMLFFKKRGRTRILLESL